MLVFERIQSMGNAWQQEYEARAHAAPALRRLGGEVSAGAQHA